MKINVEFANLEETVEFADFIKGRSMPASQQVQAAVQNTAPTPTAPSVTQAGPGVVTQQSFTGVQPPASPPVQGAAAQPQQTASAGGVPTAAVPTYTLNDLITAIQPINDTKPGQEQLKAILLGFGVNYLNELPQELYGAFATAVRGLGAQI